MLVVDSHSKRPTDRRQCVLEGSPIKQVHRRSCKYCSEPQSWLLYDCSGRNRNCSKQSKGRHCGWMRKQPNTSGRRWDDTAVGIYPFMHLFASMCFLMCFPGGLRRSSCHIWPMNLQDSHLSIYLSSAQICHVLWVFKYVKINPYMENTGVKLHQFDLHRHSVLLFCCRNKFKCQIKVQMNKNLLVYL